MIETWFATPVLLWTLLAVPAAAAFFFFAYFRRRQMIARLGASPLFRKALIVRPRVRRWKSCCVLVGIALLGLASAGPQWGIDPSAQQRKGRDVIVVLDLSRSMSAEQPSRRELAVRALRQLADTFEEHGGNRIALVAFASHAELLFPLTQDYDHLRHTLAQIDAFDTPKLSVEDAVSGTRIGAALTLAVESCDPASVNRPVVVLLSDGDDPADDEEWRQGAAAAKARKIPIHTVGIGDPRQDATIPVGRDRLLFAGEPVRTKLNEKRLQDIAHATNGLYLPAHTRDVPLGAFVQRLLDADELRTEEPDADALPVYQLRYAWFLLPAVVLFMLAMFLSEGPARPVAA